MPALGELGALVAGAEIVQANQRLSGVEREAVVAAGEGLLVGPQHVLARAVVGTIDVVELPLHGLEFCAQGRVRERRDPRPQSFELGRDALAALRL